MTLCAFARCCADDQSTGEASSETSWTAWGAWLVSKSRVALGRVAVTVRNRQKSSGKAVFVGGAAIACLVLGCSWTVYTKIISASVYPTLDSAGYDEPVVTSAPKVATRSAAQAVRDAFAALPATIERATTETVAALTPSQFNDRFAASEPSGVASRAAEGAPPEAPKVAAASKSVDAPKLAEAAKRDTASKQPPAQVAMNVPPAPRPVETKPAARSGGASLHDMAERAKVAMMSLTSRSSIVEKLWGKRDSQGALLAYASADASVTDSIAHEQSPMHGGSPPYDRSTAVYDISAHMVYLPDGTKLEAHSGLGSKLDDPSSAPIRMRGVTPPHIYELKPREALFHGVPALRLNPIGGENAIYGREGLLAHTFMLGPNGDSNGCVSFRDYSAFLNAYHNMGIRKLAVVARVE
jgi:Tlde1 domain